MTFNEIERRGYLQGEKYQIQDRNINNMFWFFYKGLINNFISAKKL